MDAANNSMSLWDKFLDAVTPESAAESVVNQIYAPGGTAQRGLADPALPATADLSLPAVYVRAKDAVSSGVENITNQIQSAFIKYAILLIAIVAVAFFLKGFLPRYGSKIASK
jgi:hypothetical protein